MKRRVRIPQKQAPSELSPSHKPLTKPVIVWLLTATLTLWPTATVQADTISQVLKLFGIGFAVRVFSSELNEVVNTLTLNHGVEVKEETKVVPILTVGSGAYIGAAQVSGPKDRVAKVEAVAQVEGEFYDRVFRVQALIPIDNLNPTETIRRVDGVGVTALLDFQI